jgi:type IV secretion system protein VirB5
MRAKRCAAKKLVITALILGPLFTGGDPAQAQLAVIDVGAITQLILEVQQLQQALQVAQNTLLQAQQAYAAITGGRGMELLLAGINRNYLPTNWAQLLGAENGGGGAYGALGGDVAATIQRNALVTPDITATFSAPENAQLNARRGAVALQEALARAELTNVSQRFDAIQTLINAIPTAVDEKGILDLQARIQVEQGMLQNENSKLHVLYEAAQSQAQTERERADEQAIVDIGHLNALPPMGL